MCFGIIIQPWSIFRIDQSFLGKRFERPWSREQVKPQKLGEDFHLSSLACREHRFSSSVLPWIFWSFMMPRLGPEVFFCDGPWLCVVKIAAIEISESWFLLFDQRYEALAGFLSRDIIDREIGQICERLPQILEDNTIIRKTQGRYRINGREVSISLVTREAKEEENWIDSGISSKDPTSNILDIIEEVNEVTETPFEANHEDLVVRDGPLTQPFLDYVFDTGLGVLMTKLQTCFSGDLT